VQRPVPKKRFAPFKSTREKESFATIRVSTLLESTLPTTEAAELRTQELTAMLAIKVPTKKRMQNLSTAFYAKVSNKGKASLFDDSGFFRQQNNGSLFF
jgi:hypothetical protein